MKRLVKMLTAVATIAAATLLPLGVWADTWTDDDDHVWTYTINNESATVTGVTGAEYDMVIPATLGGKPVVAFGTVFQGNTQISSVAIPDSVTAIAANAFNGCSQLQRVTVGYGVVSVGNYAFRSCSLLQKIELPETTTALGIGAFAYCTKLNTAKISGVTSIPGANDGYGPGNSYFNGYGSFYGCDKLRTLQLGTNLTYVGRGAFYDCNELYDLVVPDSVTHIDNYAFAECDKLHNLTLGSGIVGVGYCAFYNDTQLETLVFRGTNVNYLAARAFLNCQNLQSPTFPDGLNWIGESCFRNCDSISTITIPDSVTVCTNGAFAYCDGLRTVKLGAGLTHIAGASDGYSPGNSYFDGYGVFFGCTALTDVSFNGTLKTIGNGAFYGCSALPEITIPAKVTSIGAYAFSSCGLLQDVVIGDNVRLIKHHAFYGDAKLETLKLGVKVQTIEYCAFQSCTALKSFIFPETILTIGDWCFNGCRMLSNLVLPDSVGVIGVGSFSGCTGLLSVTIGDGLEEIAGAADGYSPGNSYFDGYGAFYGCTALTQVTIGSSVFTIGNGAFYGCSALPNITIPSNVSTIKNYAFAANTALNTVLIEDGGVTSIGNYAFDGDSSLVTASLGDRLVTIGTCAFRNCSRLTGLVLPDTLITLEGWCFAGCWSLSEIIIPDKVRELKSGVFNYCTGLTFVKIGTALSTIGGAADGYSPGNSYFDGYGAFYCCTALRRVDFGTTLTTISSGAFYGCSSLETISIPDSVTKVGAYAFGECTNLVKANMGAGVVTLGNQVFRGDVALHYVTFAGDEAPVNVGTSIFNGTKERMMVYVADGSEGWKGLHEGGLPSDGMWQGRRITYAPPPEGADNPYDFYMPALKDRVNNKDYWWPSPVMLTTNRYVSGRTIPASVDTFYDDETVYLTYAFKDYWYGFLGVEVISNRFVLSGAKSASATRRYDVAPGIVFDFLWETNAVLSILQNLKPGNYTLRYDLNSNRGLAETDYSNNSTSITFTVVAAPIWTVNFNANGGEGGEASRQVKRNTPIGDLPEPTRKGYTLAGWFTKASGGTQITASTKITSPNSTYYAQWTINQYTVAFDANGGTVGEASRVRNFGAAIGALPTPERGSYVFDGWWTARTGGIQITRSTVVEGNATCYAHWKWTAPTCAIFFHANGGSGGKTLTANTDAVLGDYMDKVVPTRDGYAFMGWWTERTGGTQVSAEDLAAGDMTYYAHWIAVPETCSIFFHANGGSGGKTFTVAGGAKLGSYMDKVSPSLSGYAFDGWWTERVGGTQILVDDIAIGDATYYAHWKWAAATCSITFHASGGTGGKKFASAATGRALSYYMDLVSPKYEANGYAYEFDGWWTERNGGDPVSATDVVSGDATYYAHWKIPTCSITFHASGGTGGKKFASVALGRTLGYYMNQVKPKYEANGYAYEFDGWWTARNGGEPVDASTVVTGGKTYYAHWIIPTCTVTFHANGGTGGKKFASVALGRTLGYYMDQVKPSYGGSAFDGWWTTRTGGTQVNAATVVTGDVTYYAHWSKTAASACVRPVDGSADVAESVALANYYGYAYLADGGEAKMLLTVFGDGKATALVGDDVYQGELPFLVAPNGAMLMVVLEGDTVFGFQQ